MTLVNETITGGTAPQAAPVFIRKAAVPLDDEAARLEALRRTGLLDSVPEPAFDDLVSWACDHFRVPIALVSLMDAERQWFKAHRGLPVQETPRDIAFCRFTIRQSLPMVVEDAASDPRFQDNPLVLGDPNIRFYAGAPIINRQGLALGSVCLIDTVPRGFGTVDRIVLAQLTVTALVAIEQRQR
ncbi:GAF domain-containing protein [Azospirillum sp. YIM B02556]|uniref:GAF domain-containing protein n=1 Tax=Azospirillum endophyticum TaxID=2800326 RepID=A0ABS1F0G8_9PROT|nr:GAF domain-containing protein [Azospirillum endophyticum]MBK1836896.1 GAF domain-containing protein [Azospirillum endophyticum]